MVDFRYAISLTKIEQLLRINAGVHVMKTLLTTMAIILSSIPMYVNAEAKFGIESSLLPYYLDGYHVSAWYGDNGYRARFEVSEASYPDEMVASGFTSSEVSFYEVEFDAYFGSQKNEFRGFWIGAGVGQSEHSITAISSNTSSNIISNDLHVSTGYTYSMMKNITVNPWVGASYYLGFPDDVVVGSDTWSPEALQLVGGFNLGIDF